MTRNYIEHILTLFLVVTVGISISAFSSLINISTEITSSTIALNICTIIVRIKKYKLIIKKKNTRNDEITLLAKIKFRFN